MVINFRFFRWLGNYLFFWKDEVFDWIKLYGIYIENLDIGIDDLCLVLILSYIGFLCILILMEVIVVWSILKLLKFCVVR